MNESALDRMKALVTEINEHCYRYYVLGQPTIADAQFDKLYDELLALEKETGIILPDSPAHRVGVEPVSEFPSFTHRARLWSMDKAQTMESVLDWIDRMKRAKETENTALPLQIVLEYKFDGLTINLTYEDGLLVHAATRGNGQVGEEILPQVKTIRSIPLRIPFKGRMEVHGEGIMRLSELEKYNATHTDVLKNARNAAAGALRNLDPNITAQRHLDAYFYDIGYIEGKEFATHEEILSFLKENQFKISEDTKVFPASDTDAIVEAIEKIGDSRDQLDFLIDGAVLKVNETELRNHLGYTDKFPRWAIAFKFEAEEMTTKLENVVWQVGRSGKLTPLAHVTPVELAGATVKRATLNNAGDIARKDLSLGCMVWIRRSNEVIPEIMGRTDEVSGEEKPIPIPEFCPVCGHRLIERGANLFCENPDCAPQIIAKLSHFASRDAMDIEGFSEKRAQLLLTEKNIRSVEQLIMLRMEDLGDLPGFGEKSARKLLDEIEEAKNRPLDALIYALGIPNVGRRTAGDLAMAFGSMEAFLLADHDALVAIDEIGEQVASGILDYLSKEENQKTIRILREHGFVGVWNQVKSDNAPLKGKTVVITGSVPGFSRTGAEKAVEELGGKPSSSVSGKTSLVVFGEGAGSKLDKARSLGIPLMTAEEFAELYAKNM